MSLKTNKQKAEFCSNQAGCKPEGKSEAEPPWRDGTEVQSTQPPGVAQLSETKVRSWLPGESGI